MLMPKEKAVKTDNLYIISGPSGAGEDSIIDGLSERLNIEKIITSTTRAPREGESQGDPYYFVSEEEFKRYIDEGAMVEWAKQYNGNLYGVTQEEFERAQKTGDIALWKIEYKGVLDAKEKFPGIVAIFIMAESLEVLEDRIRRRAEVTDEYVEERMAYTREWLNHTDVYDYTVINKEGKLEDAIDDIERIIRHHSKISN